MTSPCVTTRCELRQFPCAGPCACTVDGRDIRDHAEAAYCPHPDGPRFGGGKYPVKWESRGLGDAVAKLAAVAGIAPCSKCQERRERLNRIVPF